MSHSHGHGCDGDHDHDETPEMGIQYSLFSKIDIENLECLNESEDGAGKRVFKPWEERLDREKVSWDLNCLMIEVVVILFRGQQISLSY